MARYGAIQKTFIARTHSTAMAALIIGDVHVGIGAIMTPR